MTEAPVFDDSRVQLRCFMNGEQATYRLDWREGDNLRSFDLVIPGKTEFETVTIAKPEPIFPRFTK